MITTRAMNVILSLLVWQLLCMAGKSHRNLARAATLGEWKQLPENIGVSAMHMQLLYNDRVIIFDRTDFGPSNLSLPNGVCRYNPDDLALKVDCTAHSLEYDVKANSFRPLMVQTYRFCSSGSVLADGRLLQTGGFNDGEKKYRVFRPCADCDWQEFDRLNAPRWYATNHILPDGRIIVIGGRRSFNYEFYPTSKTLIDFPVLVQTNDPGEENNLYPFVHLNVDGNLFIFANNRAILFDYNKNSIVRMYPQIPGGDPRNYASSGSSVLLPLSTDGTEAEVLVFGGAPRGSYAQASKGVFVTALSTCGRIKITDASPQWLMENMPTPRVMNDMTLLPDGNVLIVNGASRGTSGHERATNLVLSPVIYFPDKAVGGSNPHEGYVFSGVDFPTDLTLEAFSPAYLHTEFDSIRPTIVLPTAHASVNYGEILRVQYTISGTLSSREVSVTMVSPSFATHSYSMNQRLLQLGGGNSIKVGTSTYTTEVRTPKSSILAPSGYYILYVIHQGIPSVGTWVHISSKQSAEW
ncbi:hypothetical protein C5167_044201 [Papaver somniferum]|uniref:Galactose oxidase-like Early set domain-containing protein n=1 Tax=Papaver somniferum TaxID=3469 RepID=A0A4Y7LAT8_PAPSO|nr:hypothetical protein C5167_044201 [Papaver somniferum]